MPDPYKYCLRPGLVTSINDGQEHYITARMLAELYGVPMSQCTVFRLPKEWTNMDYDAELERTRGLIHLHPREDGKYERMQRDAIIAECGGKR